MLGAGRGMEKFADNFQFRFGKGTTALLAEDGEDAEEQEDVIKPPRFLNATHRPRKIK